MTPTPTPRTDERANSWESIDGQWVNAEFARWLERELAAKDAHADEIYKASVNLAAKLEADLATEREQLAANHEATKLLSKWLEDERELADRLAALLEDCREDSCELLGERGWWKDEPRSDYSKRYDETAENVAMADDALAAWKEARRGTV